MLSAIIASADTMKYARKVGWRSAAKETSEGAVAAAVDLESVNEASDTGC